MSDPLLLTVDARGVATATFNRPERANAYDEAMLTALRLGLDRLARDAKVRCLVIRGTGRHFQAGADIEWLGRVADYSPARALAASMAAVDACRTLNEWPKPTIAIVHGACFGGGAGMVCCADVVLATPDAQFGLTEVRVGVAPTPISTHMVHAIGLRHTRRYALTGERFDAAEACRIGLVHEVVSPDRIEARLSEILDAVFLGAPGAIAATKRSFLRATGWRLDDQTADRLAHESWVQRASAEGREGTTAFRERRRPTWWVPDGSRA